MKTKANKITAANAGWRTQFHIRGSRHQPGVALRVNATAEGTSNEHAST
jgi:hypothetical protein